MRGRKRYQFKARMELQEQDYHILEAAAVTTLKRKGLKVDKQAIDDLISVGWEQVFFYDRTYDAFRRFGYLSCIREMANYLKGLDLHQRESLMTPEQEKLVYEETSLEYDEPFLPLEQIQSLIEELIQILPPQYRKVIQHRLCGRTFRHIGRLMGCSTRMAIWYNHMAIERMREHARLVHPEFFTTL